MNLELRAQSVVEKKMLPNEWWGSCHEVTDKPQGCGYASERQEVSESLGAALQSNAVTEGVFYELGIKNTPFFRQPLKGGCL